MTLDTNFLMQQCRDMVTIQREAYAQGYQAGLRDSGLLEALRTIADLPAFSPASDTGNKANFMAAKSIACEAIAKVEGKD